MLGQKGKSNTRKNSNTTWENKPESTGKRRKIKEISTKGKTIQTKQGIPKQRKKFYQQVEGDDMKTYQQPDARETEQFWSKIRQPGEHKKSRMDKQHGKIIRWTRRRSKSGNTHRFTQNNTKKISNWKIPGYNGIDGCWFKKFTSIRDRLALEMKDLQGAHIPELITKGKTTLIQKNHHKRTALNNYRPINCLPMMWKI